MNENLRLWFETYLEIAEDKDRILESMNKLSQEIPIMLMRPMDTINSIMNFTDADNQSLWLLILFEYTIHVNESVEKKQVPISFQSWFIVNVIGALEMELEKYE